MKEFERDYAAFKEIDEAYQSATDEAGKEAARADYKAWAESIEAKGKAYADTFRIYKDARDNGNDLLNISEPWQTRDVAGLIANLKAFGVTEFTFSSSWSGAVNTSWEFLQNGCELAGMTEVYNGLTDWHMNRETTPAYLFRIK